MVVVFHELICFCYNEACFEHGIGWKFWYECCILLLEGFALREAENWLKPSLHCATWLGDTSVPYGREQSVAS